MKYLAALLILAACGTASVPKPPTIPAPDVNGKAAYMVQIPIYDNDETYGVTNYDQSYIARTEVCARGFQDTKIEYAPLSDDGISTKNITFYCL